MSLSPDKLIDTETDQATIDMLYEARNNSVRAAHLHLVHTFNLHDVLHCLYDNTQVIDVSNEDSHLLVITYSKLYKLICSLYKKYALSKQHFGMLLLHVLKSKGDIGITIL